MGEAWGGGGGGGAGGGSPNQVSITDFLNIYNRLHTCLQYVN